MIRFLFLIIFIFSNNLNATEKISGNINGVEYSYTVEKINDNYFFENNKKENNFEIIYFFNYNCPYCYILNPYISFFEKRNKKRTDIKLIKASTSLKREWENSNKIFIFSRILNVDNIIADNEIFKYIHENKIESNGEVLITDIIKNIFNLNDVFIQQQMLSEEFKLNLFILDKINEHFRPELTPLIFINHGDIRYTIDSSNFNNPLSMIISINKIINTKTEN